MKPIVVLFCLFYSVVQLPLAQNVLFTRQPDLLNPISGFAAYADCAVDMNGDFLDDVIRIGNKGMYIDLQQSTGTFLQHFYSVPLSAVPSWSICAGDLDNNGLTDLLLADLGQVSFVLASSQGDFYIERLMTDSVFSQRSTMADINADGWLDAFVCDDLDQSAPFRNQGHGEMIKDTQLIITTDLPGNYSAIWTDFDHDDDSDLYLTKCLAGALPGDPRRTNQLYRKNNDGSFTEIAASLGLDDNAQSWSTVFEDFDNDGDLDVFIVNHDMQNRLFRNNGNGSFTDVISTSGINLNDLGAWENASGDFNNDGFMDIFSGLENELYLGQGNLTFIAQQAPIIPGAIADLNQDGFLDVVKNGVVWTNDGNQHHWIKVNLRGLTSNRSGIGARIEIFGSWGTQIREIRSGQSFSPMNTLSAHFGLGQETLVDSMLVTWPSGIKTRLLHLVGDSTYLIPEVPCILPSIALEQDGAHEICEGDTVSLLATEGFIKYIWSTNDTTIGLEVTRPGHYYAILIDSFGCASVTPNSEVKYKTEVSPYIFSMSGSTICQGDTLVLQARGGDTYLWSNGSQGSTEIKVNQSGIYTVAADARCFAGQVVSEPLSVSVLPAPAPIVNDVVLLPGDSVLLTASGEQCAWYDQAVGGNFLSSSCSFQTSSLQESTSFFVEAHYQYPGISQDGGKPDTTGAGGPALQSGYLIINVWEPFELMSVDVYVPEGSPQGTRFVQLWTGDTLLASKSFTIVTGLNKLPLSFQVPTGQHSIRCPQGNLFRNTGSLQYPYPIGNVGQIVTSSFGEQYYYDFFNWKIQTRDFECISNRQEINVLISGEHNNSTPSEEKIYPNPTTGMLHVNLAGTSTRFGVLHLWDSSGVKLISKKINDESIINMDISHMASGLYYLQWSSESTSKMMKVVKI